MFVFPALPVSIQASHFWEFHLCPKVYRLLFGQIDLIWPCKHVRLMMSLAEDWPIKCQHWRHVHFRNFFTVQIAKNTDYFLLNIWTVPSLQSLYWSSNTGVFCFFLNFKSREDFLVLARSACALFVYRRWVPNIVYCVPHAWSQESFASFKHAECCHLCCAIPPCDFCINAAAECKHCAKWKMCLLLL